MILATATGSSGHSLSAGGPILHPTLDCSVLNFLAPRTLSCRPLILPLDTLDRPIKMGITLESRAESVDIHLDGISVGNLKRGQLIKVNAFYHPVFIHIFRSQEHNILSQFLVSSVPPLIGIIDCLDV